MTFLLDQEEPDEVANAPGLKKSNSWSDGKDFAKSQGLSPFSKRRSVSPCEFKNHSTKLPPPRPPPPRPSPYSSDKSAARRPRTAALSMVDGQVISPVLSRRSAPDLSQPPLGQLISLDNEDDDDGKTELAIDTVKAELGETEVSTVNLAKTEHWLSLTTPLGHQVVLVHISSDSEYVAFRLCFKAWLSAKLHMQILVHLHVTKTNFHMNGFALGLSLAVSTVEPAVQRFPCESA